MERDEREALIEQYRRGVAEVEAALDGISAAELDAVPPEGWPARMIVHHLADSEMNSAVRLRKLLFEARAELQGYDEAGYARRFWYAERPIEPSLSMYRAARETSAQLLERMDAADWQRAGTHSESGRYTVQDWLTIYAAHGHEHAAQIRRARAAARG